MIGAACRDYRSALLLGEIDAACERHAVACSECTRFAQAERALAAPLRALRSRWTAGASLRERLVERLEAERAMSVRPPPRRPRRWAAALAIALAFGSSVIVWQRARDSRGTAAAHATAEVVIDDHLKYAHRGDDRLQIQSGAPLAVQAFFVHELGMAVKIPELRGAKLLGGRRCNLGGRPAALVFLEASGGPEHAAQPLSLFVFAPAGEDWSKMEEVRDLAGKRACFHEDRGVGLLVWEERGLAYVLTGAFESRDLASMLMP